jgi:hypothetical protein
VHGNRNFICVVSYGILQWIADYLDDAGYSNWATYPSIYKAMILNAFPPIDPLDDKKIDVNNFDLERLLLSFLDVADSHIKHAKVPAAASETTSSS